MNKVLLIVVVLLNVDITGVAAHSDDRDAHSSNHYDTLIEPKPIHSSEDGHDHNHHHDHHNRKLRSSTVSISSNHQSPLSKHQHYRRLNSNSTTIEHCGAKSPSTAEFEEASRVVAKWVTDQLLGLKQVQTVEIDTYFHIIANKFLIEETPTTEEIENQIIALNDAFRDHGFSFRLQGTTFTDDIDWHYAGYVSQEQTDMKTELRVGDASTLNVYLNKPTGVSSGRLLGYATFPWNYKTNPMDDGVVIYGEVTPGGSYTPFDKGMTLVHEVGHWLGLFHTFHFDLGSFQLFNFLMYRLGFRNGCTVGDGVRDTPRQKSNSVGCPTGRDSCFFRPGVDPINNYMDYSYDSCRTEFTPGQGDRMWAMWNEYRTQ